MAEGDTRGSATERQPLTFGKYQLIEPLGKGGMAEVWRALIKGPAGFSRSVVLKRILPHLAQDRAFVEMFISEAQTSAKLSHPNIIQVYELGEVGGEYFIAMEYVRGLDLSSLANMHLRDIGPIPIAVTAHVLREVCRALAYAHEFRDEDGRRMRLIHRDVSPSNIMLSDEGAVKLLDFGIAKALAETGQTMQTGSLKGKFAYMAPEQLEGNDFDQRADIFSAGIVMYEMLTGQRLFRGKNDLQTIALVKATEVKPPSLVREDLPPELDRICLRALARQPDARFQTARAMAQELDEIVHRLKVGLPEVARLVNALMPAKHEPGAAPVTITHSTPLPEGQEQATVVELELSVSAAAAEVPVPLSTTTPSPPTPTGMLPSASDSASLLAGERVSSATPLPRRRALVMGSVATAGVALGLGVILWPSTPRNVPATTDNTATSTSTPTKTSTPTPALASTTAPTTTPPVTPTPAPEPAHVSVAIASQPPGADVFLDGETRRRGKTPLTLELPRADTQHALKLLAHGYLPLASQFSTSSDLKLTLELTPKPRHLAPPPAKTHPASDGDDELANPFRVKPKPKN
jgi:serine/threonine protein kinase